MIWMADCSGSMAEDGKIQALNHAIREVIPHMRKEADENPNASIYVRAIAFSTQARWHIERPTPVDEFRWTDVKAGGETAMGHALRLATAEMKVLGKSGRLLPPVLVMVTDGKPTDDFDGGLRELMADPLGCKAVRLAIAIGDDADIERLQAFIGDPKVRPLEAHNAEALVTYFKYVSTVVLRAVSSPASQVTVTGSAPGSSVPIPAPPPVVTTDGDTW
jgi:uncharacterized protein YegL